MGLNLYRRVLVFRVALKLKQELEFPHTVEEWVDFTRSFNERSDLPEASRRLVGIAPAQIRSEIIGLLRILQETKPRRILEIGVANGGTLFLFARVAAPDAFLIGIDLPEMADGRGVPNWRTPLYSAFATQRQKVRLIRQDSHNPLTMRKAKALLKDHELDCMFIDGDHTYLGVARDFMTYSPLVRKGGLIVFHDIIPDHKTRYGVATTSHAGEVYKFWNELKAKHRVSELVSKPDQDGFGIGILEKNDS